MHKNAPRWAPGNRGKKCRCFWIPPRSTLTAIWRNHGVRTRLCFSKHALVYVCICERAFVYVCIYESVFVYVCIYESAFVYVCICESVFVYVHWVSFFSSSFIPNNRLQQAERSAPLQWRMWQPCRNSYTLQECVQACVWKHAYICVCLSRYK